MKPVRHGDIDLIAERVPETAKAVQHNGKFVLAEGEVTGHKHILSGDFRVLEDGEDRWVEVLSSVIATHEEHRTYEIPAGFYRQHQELEYSPFDKVIRKVQD